MRSIDLFELRIALVRIKSQCWIDKEGKCYWLDIKMFCEEYKTDISSVVSIHGLILKYI